MPCVIINWFDYMFQEGISKPEFFIKIVDGKIIGASAISEAIFTIDTWGISWVAVDSDFRKQGIGRDLINHCLKEIGKRNPPNVTALLSSYDDVSPFYKKLGFKGSTVDHNGDPFLAISVSST